MICVATRPLCNPKSQKKSNPGRILSLRCNLVQILCQISEFSITTWKSLPSFGLYGTEVTSTWYLAQTIFFIFSGIPVLVYDKDIVFLYFNLFHASTLNLYNEPLVIDGDGGHDEQGQQQAHQHVRSPGLARDKQDHGQTFCPHYSWHSPLIILLILKKKSSEKKRRLLSPITTFYSLRVLYFKQ